MAILVGIIALLWGIALMSVGWNKADYYSKTSAITRTDVVMTAMTTTAAVAAVVLGLLAATAGVGFLAVLALTAVL